MPYLGKINKTADCWREKEIKTMMNWTKDHVSDIRIAYIGGGSKLWAWKLMADLALEPSLGGTVCLYDIDKDAAGKNMMIGNQLKEREDCLGKWNYTTASTMEEALTGTDFVIISILPGTLDEMESDVHLPERLGILQSVGDTAGPGGMIRGLRTLPMYEEIAKAIKEYCPEAWVISYTNPMTLCVKSLYDTFPEIKAFGCCHEVFGTQKVLAGIVKEELHLEHVDRRDIHVNVLGINHFTWFNEASYQNIDLFPVYRDYIDKHFAEGWDDPERPWEKSTFNCRHRVKMDLFRRYGAIAAAGDRHLVEFMPGDTYLKDRDTVTSWRYGLTTVDFRRQQYKERLERRGRLIAGEEKMELTPSGEEGVLLIKALCGLDRVVSNVNIPNTAHQITNLPETAVVETNAVFYKNQIRPIVAGEVPEKLKALMMPHIENHERILQASKTCDMELVVKAFMEDPLVKCRCIPEGEVRRLAEDMIKNTVTYLPDGWKK